MKNKKGVLYWKIEKIVSKGKYNYAIVRNHPSATSNGYVLEHRIVMENKLGRLLCKNEIVHHIDENTKNNSIENLIVMEAGEHSRLHRIQHGRKYLILKCPNCKQIFHKPQNQTFLAKGGSYNCCSRKCSGSFSKKIQLHGLTQDATKAILENIQSEYRFYLEF